MQKESDVGGDHADNCAMLFWGPTGTGKTAFVPAHGGKHLQNSPP